MLERKIELEKSPQVLSVCGSIMDTETRQPVARQPKKF